MKNTLKLGLALFGIFLATLAGSEKAVAGNGKSDTIIKSPYECCGCGPGVCAVTPSGTRIYGAQRD